MSPRPLTLTAFDPDQVLADAQIMELWRAAARLEGVAVEADIAAMDIRLRVAPGAALADQRKSLADLQMVERFSAFFRSHARALRAAGNLHMVLSRPTPEVFR